ncbi:MAG: sigma-70 family RNA polymerase sigma factor [Ignavibacteriae bacterium]|mgnify:CR=1 FL=1|nr:sigma-70 family RNA polymerase sigma factor [Ignavibacteriota bacterium]
MTQRSPRLLPDDELIGLARGGDARAFTELVKRYEDTVYRFSYKICRDSEAASETLQDTFINVYRKLNSFDGKSKFSTWLYTIVTNNCLMKRRKRKSDLMEESLEAYDHPPGQSGGTPRQKPVHTPETPADVVIGRELKTLLEDAMAKLPEEYRVVFTMRDVEGRSTEETAGVLGLSVEATKSRLRRARAFLRDQLQPHLTAHPEILT